MCCVFLCVHTRECLLCRTHAKAPGGGGTQWSFHWESWPKGESRICRICCQSARPLGGHQGRVCVCVETGLPALPCHEPEGQAHFPAPSSNVKVSTDQRHRTHQHRLPAEPRQPQSSSSGRGAEMLRQRQPRVHAPTGQPSFQGPCEHTGALPTLRTSLYCLGGQKAASGEQCRMIRPLHVSTLTPVSAPPAPEVHTGPWGVFCFLEVNSEQQQS